MGRVHRALTSGLPRGVRDTIYYELVFAVTDGEVWVVAVQFPIRDPAPGTDARPRNTVNREEPLSPEGVAQTIGVGGDSQPGEVQRGNFGDPVTKYVA